MDSLDKRDAKIDMVLSFLWDQIAEDTITVESAKKILELVYEAGYKDCQEENNSSVEKSN